MVQKSLTKSQIPKSQIPKSQEAGLASARRNAGRRLALYRTQSAVGRWFSPPYEPRQSQCADLVAGWEERKYIFLLLPRLSSSKSRQLYGGDPHSSRCLMSCLAATNEVRGGVSRTRVACARRNAGRRLALYRTQSAVGRWFSPPYEPRQSQCADLVAGWEESKYIFLLLPRLSSSKSRHLYGGDPHSSRCLMSCLAAANEVRGRVSRTRVAFPLLAPVSWVWYVSVFVSWGLGLGLCLAGTA
ncbi:hypothetical protein B0H63DRAFT_186393 [Podospora didyma]|uniref:Uncharacterized protein n=1 Tax=Podospora didyma TaxID=330526 RepID=A0AAE0NQ94_9PEZI|nr:hypothetical protein B0H63DRAFT_186393 [Podospora didyma]